LTKLDWAFRKITLWQECANSGHASKRHECPLPCNFGRWVRRLPLDDAGLGADSYVLLLSANHGLSAYDAAYLELALNRDTPLATLDRKLAAAARKEGVTVLGPFSDGN
jgi:hypothetical protein